ncbi:MAG: glycosyltransferase family 87 protein [Planctomycetota bacterium]
MMQLGVGVLGLLVAAVVLLRPVWALGRSDRSVRIVLGACAIAVVGAAVGRCAVNVWRPRPWDFPMFYTTAKAGFEGRRFYRPEVLESVFADVQESLPTVPGDWLGEAGYFYLPPSVLPWLPLGALGYRAALVLASTFQIGCLFAAAWWLRRRVGDPWASFLETIALVFAFRPTQTALGLGQIAPVAVLGLALAATWTVRRPLLAGASLALAFLAKHLVALLVIPWLLSRRLRPVAAAVVVIAGLFAVSFWMLPEGTFDDWARHGPSAAPPFFYTQDVNQSLLAISYRAFGESPSSGGMLEAWTFWPFCIGALALTLATLLGTWRRTSETDRLLAIWTCWALLLYPSTLYNTLPILLVPILLWRSARSDFPWITLLGLIIYGSAVIRPEGGFVAVAATWGITLVAWPRIPAAEAGARATA